MTNAGVSKVSPRSSGSVVIFVDQGEVFHLYPFGFSRGAGGIDDVGEVFGGHRYLRIPSGESAQVGLVREQ